MSKKVLLLIIGGLLSCARPAGGMEWRGWSSTNPFKQGFQEADRKIRETPIDDYRPVQCPECETGHLTQMTIGEFISKLQIAKSKKPSSRTGWWKYWEYSQRFEICCDPCGKKHSGNGQYRAVIGEQKGEKEYTRSVRSIFRAQGTDHGWKDGDDRENDDTYNIMVYRCDNTNCTYDLCKACMMDLWKSEVVILKTEDPLVVSEAEKGVETEPTSQVLFLKDAKSEEHAIPNTLEQQYKVVSQGDPEPHCKCGPMSKSTMGEFHELLKDVQFTDGKPWRDIPVWSCEECNQDLCFKCAGNQI